MRPSRARDSAIKAITTWPLSGRRAPRLTASIRQLFGIHVFSDEVMKARLPENIYKAIRNTIKKGAPLDSSIADVVAATMTLSRYCSSSFAVPKIRCILGS